MDFYVYHGMRIMGQNTRQLRLGIPIVYQVKQKSGDGLCKNQESRLIDTGAILRQLKRSGNQ